MTIIQRCLIIPHMYLCMSLFICAAQRPRSLSKKVSVIPAVEVAHPGASYNPSFDDHQVSTSSTAVSADLVL